MKKSNFYLWTYNASLNIVEIRAFRREGLAERWYLDSGFLGQAIICYSISDVKELNTKFVNDTTIINYVKNHKT